LQSIYPVSKRSWSTSDMGTWKNGSMKVICSPSQDEPKTITPETEINIWFDDSGSMSDVLPNLETMRDEVLKPCLLPFYGGNETVYSQRFRVRKYSDANNVEKTFQVLGTSGSSSGVTQVINIAFQDEANSGYHPRSDWSEEDVDIAWLRERLQTTGPDYISGAVLRVEGNDDFLDLLRNVMVSGSAPYAGANNLLPYTQNGTAQLALYENIKRPGYSLGSNNTEDGSPLYYANKVVEAINDIGYSLAPCAGYQNPPISITPVILSQSPAEGATIGLPYTAILTAVGGTQPYTWSLPSGALPPGLTLDPITGIISGTPTAVGSNNFSVKVVDDNNQSDEKSFALEVKWPPLGVEWSEETPTLTAGQPANPEVFTASGGDGNYTWSVSSGSLPPGISLSGNSGKTVSLSGTPATAGTYNFIVKALSAGQEMNIDVSYIVELGPQPTPTPSPSPTPTPSDMVTVEGGTLPSGSGLAGQAISTFQIGKYEVTWGEWQSVRTWAAANGYTDLAGVGNGTAGNHPVQQVSWFDVVKWCNAKSEKEGMTPVYQVGAATYKTGQSTPTVNSASNGYRLPSEKEWEWAARGGLLSGNFTYSGSNDVNAVAWINSIEGPNEVGTKASNELGIHDMSGNVKEWCFDTSSDLWRRARGGSYDSLAFVAAVGYRDIGEFPEIRYKRELGFRLARSSAQ
jgi:formylglycine-generating enzyme required for sulfatase activity